MVKVQRISIRGASAINRMSIPYPSSPTCRDRCRKEAERSKEPEVKEDLGKTMPSGHDKTKEFMNSHSYDCLHQSSTTSSQWTFQRGGEALMSLYLQQRSY